MSKKSHTQDPRIYASLFPTVLSKATKTKIRIIEAAIRSYSIAGMEGSSIEAIANASKVTRPLVHHYFKDKDELFTLAAKYIRNNFQQLAIQAIENSTTVPKKLLAYIDSTFNWVEQYPNHVKTWLLFYHQCAIKKRYLDINDEFVSMGHKRLTGLIEIGNGTGDFKSKSPSADAKLIQNLITGNLLALCTESQVLNISEMKKMTFRTCLLILGNKSG